MFVLSFRESAKRFHRQRLRPVGQSVDLPRRHHQAGDRRHRQRSQQESSWRRRRWGTTNSVCHLYFKTVLSGVSGLRHVICKPWLTVFWDYRHLSEIWSFSKIRYRSLSIRFVWDKKRDRELKRYGNQGLLKPDLLNRRKKWRPKKVLTIFTTF